MLFKVKIDAEFDADNIDDALTKLAVYFSDPMNSNLLCGGEVDIKPLEEKKRCVLLE